MITYLACSTQPGIFLPILSVSSNTKLSAWRSTTLRERVCFPTLILTRAGSRTRRGGGKEAEENKERTKGDGEDGRNAGKIKSNGRSPEQTWLYDSTETQHQVLKNCEFSGLFKNHISPTLCCSQPNPDCTHNKNSWPLAKLLGGLVYDLCLTEGLTSLCTFPVVTEMVWW